MKTLLIFSIFIILFSTNIALADNEYADAFDTLDLFKWSALTKDTWQVLNGTVSSTSSRTGLILEKWNGEEYISEVDLTANKTRIPNYAVIGFYFHYGDSDNYGRIGIRDDNRGIDYTDSFYLDQKGFYFTNTLTHINTSSNTSVEFDPNVIHHLKVVRLNKKVYVYFDDRLALTTEFKDENPSGKVGFDVYECTGYFDNFYLRPIEMKNASGYFNELNLTSVNPTTRLGEYLLRLEDVQSGTAFLSLSKFGRVIDTVAVSEGVTTAMNYENGEEGVEFKLVTAFNGSTGSRVELEDVIYAISESLAPRVENLSLQSTYYQGEDMTVTLTLRNPGAIRYTGTPELTASTTGSASITEHPELNLAAGESQELTIHLTTPKTPGKHTLTLTLKLDEYTTTTKSMDYTVRALNPTITTLSPDLREEDGIRGTVTIGSAHPDTLVDWNTTAHVEVFRVFENGKQRVYNDEIPVKEKEFNLNIPYPAFYQGDGQYLTTITVGEMNSNKFFNIIGSDGTYEPTKNKALPPTIISNNLYPQLMLLLMGMVAALSVRNHFHPRSWTLPLDLTAISCGSIIILAGILLNQAEMVSRGIILGGVGIGLSMARRSDQRLNTLLLMGTPIHDFTGMTLIFLTSSYVILQNPEWNIPLLMGTLITYYTLINLHGERRVE